MALHRRLAEHEALADLPVREALVEEVEHLALARREVELRTAHPVDEPVHDGGGEDAPARRGGADRVEQGRGGRVLEEVAGGARLDRGEDVGVVVVVRDDEHGRRGDERPQALRRGHAALGVPAEAEVHRHDVDRLACAQPRLGAGRGLVGAGGLVDDDDEVAGGLEHRPQALSDDGVVVGHEDSDHAPAPSRGIRTDTSVPPPGSAMIAALPPSSAARARRPGMP